MAMRQILAIRLALHPRSAAIARVSTCGLHPRLFWRWPQRAAGSGLTHVHCALWRSTLRLCFAMRPFLRSLFPMCVYYDSQLVCACSPITLYSTYCTGSALFCEWRRCSLQVFAFTKKLGLRVIARGGMRKDDGFFAGAIGSGVRHLFKSVHGAAIDGD